MTTKEKLAPEGLLSNYESILITNFAEQDMELVRDLIDFWSRQSDEDVYFRFFSSRPPCEAAYCSILKGCAVMVAVYENIKGQTQIVGYAEVGQDRDESGWHEVGIAVDREARRKGIASAIIATLRKSCQEINIRRVKAVILPGNEPMLKLINKLAEGQRVSRRFVEGCYEYRIES